MSDQDDIDSAAWAAQEELEARRREEDELAKHKRFRRECDDFERNFERRQKQIFNSTHTGA